MHVHSTSKRLAQWLLAVTVAMLLTACGFQLRGAADLPFKSIYLGFTPNSPMGVELRRNIRASGGEVVENADQADAVLKVLADSRDKQVLTLNTNGRVREYAL